MKISIFTARIKNYKTQPVGKSTMCPKRIYTQAAGYKILSL